jgi:competence protein ComEC
MPFHLEGLPLHLMGWGIDVMLAMGNFVSGLPGAVTVSRAFPLAALVAISIGGLWLAIWRRAKRWWGLLPMALGVAWALLAPSPDILVAADARTIAIRGGDGVLLFPRKPKDNFAASRWLARDGDMRMEEGQMADRRIMRDAVGGANCDDESCVGRVRGQLVAMPFRQEAVAEDCARAAILIAAVPVNTCNGPQLVLDSKTIAQGEGYVITNGKAFSVRESRGNRPWNP